MRRIVCRAVRSFWTFYRWLIIKGIEKTLNHPDSYGSLAFMKLKGLQPISLQSIQSDLSFKSTLLGHSTSTTIAPSWHGSNSRPLIRKHKSLSLRIFRDATVSAYAGGVVASDVLYVPSEYLMVVQRFTTDGASLFVVNSTGKAARLPMKKKSKLRIENAGVLIGGPGAFNWYHFVIECLPKVFLIDKSSCVPQNIPLIVPVECARIRQFSEALETFSSGRPVVYADRNDLLQVSQLYVIDEITFGPFNLVEGAWPSLSDYRQHDAALGQFCQEFRTRILKTRKLINRRGRRLFLARPGIRRKYNQDELLEIATEFGFESFEPENLSLEEQAYVFSEASQIVGPSGAAWVGLLFCEQPIKALSWLPKEYSEFCSYSTLAHMLGHQLSFIESHYDSALKSTGDAYVGSYKVSPELFRRALINVCELC